MANLDTLSKEQQQVLETAVSEAQSDQAKVAAVHADYHNAMVSLSATVGPDGAGMQGWITYTRSGDKIHFSLEGKPSTFYGLFAGGGGDALIGALPAGRLGGQTGRFKIIGGLFGGLLYMWHQGQPVFTRPIPLAGAGTPSWCAEGDVKFSWPQ